MQQNQFWVLSIEWKSIFALIYWVVEHGSGSALWKQMLLYLINLGAALANIGEIQPH